MMAAYISPALTTIELPIEVMTRKAIEKAIELINQQSNAISHQYKGKLIQRESVTPLHSTSNWLSLYRLLH
ncbi:hypothetical protein DI392_15495 [Vibrio albus]|uniref:Transcriptional regulator LacI/GalR-like sensor domain-containing protein n=2 Tax=Vibrio albus TaxID=2200953 RepID=A0A2U3B6Q1_9VIBR|nr:hypothetical protein DI392_15495 [Vibrio albus]